MTFGNVDGILSLTLAVAQVLDLDAFLLLTGCLLHLAGVVIGTAIRGTHWIEADVGTVDVAHAPVAELHKHCLCHSIVQDVEHPCGGGFIARC